MPDDLESPEIEEVRRLLTQLRYAEPMPADVAARLDDAIAGLARAADDHDDQDHDRAPVVSLASRRRRRVAGWLVAAAAVAAAFVVIPHIRLDSSSSSAATSGGSNADMSAAGKNPHRPEARATGQGQAKLQLTGGRVVVRPQHFRADVRRADRPDLFLDHASPESQGSSTCGVVGSAVLVVPAEYQGAPAALAYRHASGGSQVVDLYLCGEEQPVRSTTLPAP